ncbi:hypothetical protein [Rhodococcus sp. 077-4]|uniref:hypothetical protein n=1 Tax=Rhodococcus sp. 077-4 TaxID=2789271 RepID=UPI0039F5BA27
MSEPKSKRRNNIEALFAVAIATLGGAAFVLGGADDSPGLQLIGVLLVLSAGWISIRR